MWAIKKLVKIIENEISKKNKSKIEKEVLANTYSLSKTNWIILLDSKIPPRKIGSEIIAVIFKNLFKIDLLWGLKEYFENKLKKIIPSRLIIDIKKPIKVIPNE